jgi:hypothetical protein
MTGKPTPREIANALTTGADHLRDLVGPNSGQDERMIPVSVIFLEELAAICRNAAAAFREGAEMSDIRQGRLL